MLPARRTTTTAPASAAAAEEPRGFERYIRDRLPYVWSRLLHLGRELVTPGELAARLTRRLDRIDPARKRARSMQLPLARLGPGGDDDTVLCPGCGEAMTLCRAVEGDREVGDPGWWCGGCDLVIDRDAGLVRVVR